MISARLYVGTVIGVLLVWMLTIVFPRYDWRDQSQGPQFAPNFVRIDRWTGRAEQGFWVSGQWMARSLACQHPTGDLAEICHQSGL